jgi:hypothetical protein
VLFACASMSKYSVLCSSRVQSLEIFTSVCWVSNLSLSCWDLAIQ